MEFNRSIYVPLTMACFIMAVTCSMKEWFENLSGRIELRWVESCSCSPFGLVE